jgi:hypothetical protein
MTSKALTLKEVSELFEKWQNGELHEGDIDRLFFTAELFHSICEDASERIEEARENKN